jgi:hypothetical protein
VVFTGFDPVSGKRMNRYETVRAPNTRAGAKQADARLAAIISAVEEGREIESANGRRNALSMALLAERWQKANRPRQNDKTGDWIGWSPKTAKTHADNFRLYILPTLGARVATKVTGLQLDELYQELEDRGLSASVVVRCHSQVRAMYAWALRKKLVTANPALSADPPRIKAKVVGVPSMADVRKVQGQAPPMFGTYIQLAATIGARRGTMVALRWGNVDLEGRQVTFERAVAESATGQVEKGTKADGPMSCRWAPAGPSCSPATGPDARRTPEQSVSASVPSRSCSPTTGVSPTGTSDGPPTRGSATPPRPGWTACASTTCATRRPARC